MACTCYKRCRHSLTVKLHPDGKHGKRFDIPHWLSARGFALKESHGTTGYCGTYVRRKQVVVVTSIPGRGDVVAKTHEGTITAECKGGIINTRHAGQASRLRKGLCEAVGLLMASPKAGRQVAVVPKTETKVRLAQRLAPRAKEAGMEIALVDELGQVSILRREARWTDSHGLSTNEASSS